MMTALNQKNHYMAGESIFDNDFRIFPDLDEKRPESEDFAKILSILPLKNTVLFPGTLIPITVTRDKSIQLVKEANAQKNKLIGVVAQIDSQIENPTTDDLFLCGTVAQIARMLKMPDGSVTILLQGKYRMLIDEFVQIEPYFKAQVRSYEEDPINSEEEKALTLSIKQFANRIIELSPNIPNEAQIHLHNLNGLSQLTHFIASNLNISVSEKQNILATNDLKKKANLVLAKLQQEIQILELSEEIQSKVKNDLDKQQRDYLLRQQIRTIQEELGEHSSPDNDIEELIKRSQKKKWTAAAQETFQKEIAKLRRLNPNSPEYGVSMNYVDWMLELPWAEFTKDKFDLVRSEKILEKDHYGLETVKQRILEYLAVLQLKKDMKAPILCLYGPPGVGKTSLGKSIAKALNRKFVRISLGGVRDEAEIRGHRRTYIGSMPGRILQGLKKAKSGNPVFMLDEIDKIGSDWKGDPSSALLEVLDPEQNFAFNDHYLELDYDLSTILFIATANNLDTIHPALRDRMEIIEINGYSQEEKVEIAKRHLIPEIR
ncbi:MAG: LON peptidase substrate-binding domain-containing protein, partial [Bacteroidia bacterium]|nr:LON peptidase substrate-binding domain-containing protein [Bacteroidia bacterium]